MSHAHKVLQWSEWFPWEDIRLDRIPVPEKSGVYEARNRDQEVRFTIGETNLLKRRVSYLVKGTHSAGEKIRKNEDVANVIVRWAVTERHKEVEEELHREHCEKFGVLPTYVKRTG